MIPVYFREESVREQTTAHTDPLYLSLFDMLHRTWWAVRTYCLYALTTKMSTPQISWYFMKSSFLRGLEISSTSPCTRRRRRQEILHEKLNPCQWERICSILDQKRFSEYESLHLKETSVSRRTITRWMHPPYHQHTNILWSYKSRSLLRDEVVCRSRSQS